MTRMGLAFLMWLIMLFAMPTQAVDRDRLEIKKKATDKSRQQLNKLIGYDESEPGYRLLDKVKKNYVKKGLR